MPRASTWTPPPSRGLGGCDQRLAVLLLEVGGLGRVADVDRRERPVLGELAALGERVGDGLDALDLADLLERVLDRRRGSGP